MNKRATIIFIIFVVVALVLVVTGNIFSVKNVKVEIVWTDVENTRLDVQGIVDCSLVFEKNIFTISEKKAAQNVENSYPYAKVVTIERSFPSSLTIYVKERFNVLAVEYQTDVTRYALIDEECKVTEIVTEKPSDIPVVSGVKVESAKPAERLKTTDNGVDKLENIVSACSAMGYKDRQFVSTVESVDFTKEDASVINISTGVKFVFNNVNDVKYQVLSFMNWYTQITNSTYRTSGTAKIVGEFDPETERYGIIWSED